MGNKVNIRNEETLREVLIRFAQQVRQHTEEKLSSNQLKANGKVKYLKKRISNISTGEWQTEETFKKQWHTELENLLDGIQTLTEFSSAVFALKESQIPDPARVLDRLASIVFADVVYPVTAPSVGRRVDTLLQELKNEPVTFSARVELIGLIIDCPRIEWSFAESKWTLRSVEIADLEKEYLAELTGFEELNDPTPTAILEINTPATGSDEVQTHVEKAICILRLLGTGSVNSPTYSIRSDSIVRPSNIIRHPNVGVFDTVSYSLDENWQRKLADFWVEIGRMLPEDFYDSSEPVPPDHKTIAYQRYSDALLGGARPFERRVTNAVMGLESLYLPSGPEVGYRLRTSVSKVLSRVGYNPLKVKEIVKDAYDVKSVFMRGGLYHKKDALEKKYGDLQTFGFSILDYLRMSILIFIPLQVNKEDFIELVENALLEDSKKLDRTIDSKVVNLCRR